MKLSKALTWDELANLYDKYHPNRPARTLEMGTVFQWGKSQTDKFMVSEEGTIHLITKEITP